MIVCERCSGHIKEVPLRQNGRHKPDPRHSDRRLTLYWPTSRVDAHKAWLRVEGEDGGRQSIRIVLR